MTARTAVLQVTKSEQSPFNIYRYSLSTSATQADDPMALRVEVKLNSQMVETLCGALQTASESPDDSRQQLRSLGHTLYRLLFNQSEGAKMIANRLADWRDALIIASDEVQIPWESLHDGKDFLGGRLAIGRQMVTYSIFDRGRPVGEIQRALIISNPTEDLPASGVESARLAAYLKGRGIECTHLNGKAADLVAVSGELRDGGYDIFHYSGHVGLDTAGRPALRLSDMYFADDDIQAMMAAFGDTPTRAAPIVFVNGCRSAAHMTSVCRAFLYTGSRIVLGTRYRVEDAAACDFAELWYGNLLSGMTAGGALRACRSAQSEGPSGAWAAFVLFGRPWTQLWPEGEKPAVSVPQRPAKEMTLPGRFWNDHADWLEPELAGLIRWITDSATDTGAVTSFHLAAGLITVENPLSSAIESKIERSTVIDALKIFTGLEGEGTRGRGDVEMSGTVRHIFEMAIQKARTAGRVRIGVEDVALAFMATGGGNAGELLVQLGVELSTEPSLFQSGVLNSGVIAPETQRAIHCAHVLSSVRGRFITSHALVLGCVLAGSPDLREALLDQGSAGKEVVRLLFSDAPPLSSRDFSRRGHLALAQALAEGEGTVNDAQLLAHALNDPESAASALIQSWGLNRERLRASLLARKPTADNG